MDRMLMNLAGWRSCLALGVALAVCGNAPSAIAQAPATPGPTVAVLPLENNSGDAAQDFFAGGMTDEIAAALTGVRGLDVVARSSSFRLKPSNRDLKTHRPDAQRELSRARRGAHGGRSRAPECPAGAGERRRAAVVAGL